MNESASSRLAAILTGGEPPADLYSVEGSRLYERFAEFDDSEQRELLRRLAATEGDILELACGGGRLALPFLALGRPVVGIDLSEEMIRILQDRYDRLPRSRRRVPLTAVVADMRNFELGRLFGAIVLATTSIFLLDASDREQLFAAVRRHLAPGGLFFVTVYESSLEAGASSTRLVPLTGVVPAVALLSDQVREDGRTREVTALQISRDHEGALDVAAFSSVVHTASKEELDDELVRAGFTHVESIALSGGDAGGLRIRGYSL
ncbi:daptide-type RiPP biosynthesis methyltransferase [Microbacterium sp. 179-I 3D2 NHS]|uniref:daptide-type RiPP biosynthesis methyltransferase n=1 Tax=Microbacterium sp. 179-I 3D2 NHS TaxID=3235178 RepID=UPI0039A3148D